MDYLGIVVVEVHAETTLDEDIEYLFVIEFNLSPRPVEHVQLQVRRSVIVAGIATVVVIVEQLLYLSGQIGESGVVGDRRATLHVRMHQVDEETVKLIEGQVRIPGVVERIAELHLVINTRRFGADVFGDVGQRHAYGQAVNIQRYQLRRGVYLGQVKVLGVVRCLGQ